MGFSVCDYSSKYVLLEQPQSRQMKPPMMHLDLDLNYNKLVIKKKLLLCLGSIGKLLQPGNVTLHLTLDTRKFKLGVRTVTSNISGVFSVIFFTFATVTVQEEAIISSTSTLL